MQTTAGAAGERPPQAAADTLAAMGAVIVTTATNAGDSMKLIVTESYDEAVERVRAAAGGGMALFTLQQDGKRVAVNPAHVAFVREPFS
jgi:hypothetical protein